MTYSLPFRELGANDIPLVGGKGASLGEMATAGFPVSSGFVLTTDTYGAFVAEHDLQKTIVDLASAISADDARSAADGAAAISALFLDAEIPADIGAALLSAYEDLTGDEEAVDGETAIAVRSSATA